MSRVSSDYNVPPYYNNKMSELKEELDRETRRNRELREQESNRLQKSYQTALNRKDEESEKAINNVREKSSESIDNEKTRYRDQLEQLHARERERAESNDLTGQKSLRHYYDRTVNDLQEQSKIEANQNRDLYNERMERAENSYRNDLLKKEKENSAVLERIQSSAQDGLSNERERFQEAVDQLNRKNYDAHGRITKMVPLETHKREIDSLSDANRLDRAHSQENLEEVRENSRHSLEQIGKNNARQISELVQNQKEEVSEMGSKLKDLNDLSRVEARKQAEVQRQLVKDSVKQQKAELTRVEDDFNATNADLRQSLRDQASYLGRQHAETLSEKDKKHAENFSKLNTENFRKVKNLEDEFSNQIDNMEKQREIERDRNSEVLSDIIKRDNERLHTTLEDQGTKFKEASLRTKAATDFETELLKKQLHHQKTSSDVKEIPAGAESKLRNSVITEYEKMLQKETEKNKLNTDGIQQKYREIQNKLLDEHADKLTQTAQRHALEKILDQTRQVDAINEVEYSTKTKLRDQESNHSRENQNLYRQFAMMMERQKNDYDHILENSRSDAAIRLATQRSEAEIEMKNALHEFTIRQNEISRDFDKKFNDQKIDFDFKLTEQKAQAQNELRDVERRAKQELENQARNYELRISQMESQNKEREKILHSMYRDELDKTRHSYELSNKKRS